MNQPQLFDTDIIHRTATFGEKNGRPVYRYRLVRSWEPFGPIVNFIMLNPSTADDQVDDPTIRRCLSFARGWGAGSLVVTNLFAYRATNPKELGKQADPIGPENDAHILRAAGEASIVVAAWGNEGARENRSSAVLAMLRAQGCRPVSLRMTKAGEPEHPLYLPGNLPITPLWRDDDAQGQTTPGDAAGVAGQEGSEGRPVRADATDPGNGQP